MTGQIFRIEFLRIDEFFHDHEATIQLLLMDFYSRSIKKKVLVLANPDLHKLASKL